MKNIKISPKHGLNPLIPKCFFCGKEKNEIAVLGKIDREDSEAPRSAIIDYVPCEACQKKFESGILLIEVSEEPVAKNQMEIIEGAYPTGKWVLVLENFIRQLIVDEDLAESVIKSGHALIPVGILENIIKE